MSQRLLAAAQPKRYTTSIFSEGMYFEEIGEESKELTEKSWSELSDMEGLEVVEIKAFVPAQNYEVSKAFYHDLGFIMASDEDGIAYFHGCIPVFAREG